MVEKEIILKAQSGDKEAFRMIYNEHKTFVWNTVWWMFRDKTQMEDVTQEIFLKIYNKLKTFVFSSNIKTWIYRIAINTAIDISRKNKRCGSVNLEDVINTSVVESGLKNLEERQLYDRIFVELKPENKAILILREIEGMEYDEIAYVLNIPKGTVRSRLSRAREEFIEIFNRLEGLK